MCRSRPMPACSWLGWTMTGMPTCAGSRTAGGQDAGLGGNGARRRRTEQLADNEFFARQTEGQRSRNGDGKAHMRTSRRQAHVINRPVHDVVIESKRTPDRRGAALAAEKQTGREPEARWSRRGPCA